jgi:hypothetical protein
VNCFKDVSAWGGAAMGFLQVQPVRST